jgi:hypothetical protein
MITPPPRAVLGFRRTHLLIGLALGAMVACAHPSDSGSTVGNLTGAVRDAETDAPIEGATLVVPGRGAK